MPNSLGINRNVNTISISAAATLGPDTDQVVANATSAGFTITLCDFYDGAAHQVEIIISPSDSSGNTVSVSGNAGAFTTSLASSGTSSALLQTQANGTWFVVSDVSAVSAGSASSAATSAGLQASLAQSGATSLVITDSSSRSIAASATLSGTSASQSVAASATLSGTSASQSIAASATLSGTSASQSIAASATLSGVSNAISVATSQNTATSEVASVNLSTALSAAESA